MVVSILLTGLLAMGPEAASVACPFLDATDAQRALGGEVGVEVADFDSALDGASSCRFVRVAPGGKPAPGRLVLAELGVASASADPFVDLRSAELAQLEVPGARWVILVPAGALGGADAWYRGLAGSEVAGPEAVVLLWSDEDGFETVILLEAPGRSAEAQFTELTRLVRRLARTP